MIDLAIDPLTHDYFEDPDVPGQLATVDTIETMAYLQLTSEKDAWVGDPDAGTNLSKLRRMGASARAAQEGADTMLAALQALVDAGFGYDPKAEASVDGGRLEVSTSIRDRAHGEVALFDNLPYEV